MQKEEDNFLTMQQIKLKNEKEIELKKEINYRKREIVKNNIEAKKEAKIKQNQFDAQIMKEQKKVK